MSTDELSKFDELLELQMGRIKSGIDAEEKLNALSPKTGDEILKAQKIVSAKIDAQLKIAKTQDIENNT